LIWGGGGRYYSKKKGHILIYTELVLNGRRGGKKLTSSRVEKKIEGGDVPTLGTEQTFNQGLQER